MIVQVDPEASPTDLGKKLALLQKSGELCDFKIVVSGSEIKAHKCVLAASCGYFKASFSFSDRSLSITEADFNHVCSDARAVESIIRSFYTNEIELNPSYLESILLVTDYLMHDGMRDCIEKYMCSSLSFRTAVLYFRLALQFRLYNSRLINDTRWLLVYRFHDYFIYQQEMLECGPDMLADLVLYDIFKYCNPLQIAEFMLKNIKIALEKLHSCALETHMDMSKETDARLDSTFKELSGLLITFRPEIMELWRPHLVHFFKTWRMSNLSTKGEDLSDLFWFVQGLELQLSDDSFEVDCICMKSGKYHTCIEKLMKFNYYRKTLIHKLDSFSVVVCENANCDVGGEKFIPAQHSDTSVSEIVENSKLKLGLCACCTPRRLKKLLPNMELNDPESERNPVAESKQIDGKTSWTNLNKQLTTKAVGHSSQTAGDDDLPGSTAALSQDVPEAFLPSRSGSFQDKESRILVVLAPTADMAAQLLATDEESDRRLVRKPKLELAYFDIEMETWCRGCKLDFPINGPMLEKHSWRIAFFNSCLYMFSLSLETGLQYNTLMNAWEQLECHNIFSPHCKSIPVKSVIPNKVGRKLIVLSMSRESLSDGTFLTHQHYFEMQDDCRTFLKVASIQGDQRDMPITQVTVSEHILVTVKSSSMVNGTLSHIQHINLYNSETRLVRTFEAVCTMEAGVKILVKDEVIHIVNKDGWCRLYDFKTSTWGDMKRHQTLATSTTWKHVSEPTYPALTHVSCQDGDSRWEVLSDPDKIHSRMLKMMVTEDENIELVPYPSPPFQFLTAVCPSTMSRTQLDAMEQPHFAQVDNLMLDFTFLDQMQA